MADEFTVTDVHSFSMLASHVAEKFVFGNRHWEVPDTSL